MQRNFSSQSRHAFTPAEIRQAKGQRKLVMLTAYDYLTALHLDASGVDLLLVGDSLGMVVYGQKDTLAVTLDDMIRHSKAVCLAAQRALVVADLPFMSYEPSVESALANASRLVRETGVRAVKLEGGRFVLPQVKALVQCGIAVMGHLGLTPQRAATLGGFKVQARSAAAAELLLEESLLLEEAGCFSLVLEAVPSSVAALVSRKLSIPIIGIGAGADCDGQVLVLQDLLGLHQGHVPKFVKQYAQLNDIIQTAAEAFAEDVRSGVFPASQHSFSMSREEEAELLKRS